MERIAADFGVSPEQVRAFLNAPDADKLDLLRAAGFSVPDHVAVWDTSAGQYLEGRQLAASGQFDTGFALILTSGLAEYDELITILRHTVALGVGRFLRADVAAIAQSTGLSGSYVPMRLHLQELAIVARQLIDRHAPGSYSEVWIDDDRQQLVIGEVSNSSAISDVLAVLGPAVRTQPSPVSRAEIAEILATAQDELEAKGSRAFVAFDAPSGTLKFEPYAGDGDSLSEALDNLMLARRWPNVRVELRSAVALEPMATLRGATGWSGSCTPGFTMSAHPNYDTGITTAAHCNNDTRYFAGVALPFKLQATGPGNDVQFHDWPETGGHLIENEIYSSISPYTREITSVATPGYNDLVCHEGKTTGYSCGRVTDSDWNGFFRVDLAMRGEGGDRGGPGFINNSALGTFLGGVLDSQGNRIGYYFMKAERVQTMMNADIHVK